MVASEIILELSLIIGIAAAFALLGKLVKQPSIIAYLITGIIVGPLFLNILKSNELIGIFSQLGVAFLLFLIGLSLDFRVLKEVGPVSFLAGIGQVVVTSVLGFFLSVWLGFSYISSLFIAAALAFSSTVFVLKLLADKKEKDTLHGKIAIGILIVQDFIAAIVLLSIPVIGSSTGASMVIGKLFIGALLILAIFFFARLIVPGILSLAARSQEVLLLFTLAWAFLIAMLFDISGFSVEIGALVAGMTLASSKFSLEMSSKIKGMREFFIIIHLIFFGTLLVGPINSQIITGALILSALVLIGNPLIIMTLMKRKGYKKRTNFLTGISVAQISEFSLILVFIGFVMGAVPQSVMTLTILVALITIGVSSYGIYYSNKLYRLFKPLLNVFDGNGKEPGLPHVTKEYNIILFGYNRIGFNLLKSFNKANKKCLVVDFNPTTIETLSSKGISCVYGDANDLELLKSLKLNKAKTIISTIPELETNLTILENIPDKKIIFIPTSHLIGDTRKLYEAGADYVIMPHFLGGDYMAHLLVKDNFNKKLLDQEGKKQLREVEERANEGHEHPRKGHHGD